MASRPKKALSLWKGSVISWDSGSLLECGKILQAQIASLTSRQCMMVCESRLHNWPGNTETTYAFKLQM